MVCEDNRVEPVDKVISRTDLINILKQIIL